MKLWQQVTLGLVLGTLFGAFFPEYTLYIKPIGTIFLRMIFMVIYPLVFFTLISGITSLSDPSSLGRIGMKSVVAFLVITIFAVIFGIVIALVIEPGVGVKIDFGANISHFHSKPFDFAEFFTNIVPNNIFIAFFEGNILQIVFFAIFTGITINSIGPIANPIKSFIHLISKIVLKMISIVIMFSPYGAFSLTAWVVGAQGINILFSLSKLIMAVCLAMAFQYAIFGILIYVFCRISPIPFYKKSLEYQAIAFSTASSKAALATTMKVCKERLGISESCTSFVLPLGAVINMDGLAIYLSLCTIFFAQILGVTLTVSDYFIIVIMSTLGSIGGAGIPGGALIMLPMVLSAVNLPIEGVAIIAGIDRILDMIRTTINMTGDATVTLIVDHNEGTFNKEKYFSK